MVFLKLSATFLDLQFQNFFSTAETDQGVALKSSVQQQGFDHLRCLRHLLVSLGTSKFSSQVGNLVSACCQKDYNELKRIYEVSWVDLTAKDKQKLKKKLGKVGLAYIDGNLMISDENLWAECSMLKRANTKMPSCTNQLESVHVSMNTLTPRRNSFWSSMKRLIDETNNRTRRFDSNFRQNYARHKRKIKRIISNTPRPQFESAIQYYQTNAEDEICFCGESVLMSSMLDVQIPCSHLHHLGMPFPEITPPIIDLTKSIDGYLLDEVIIVDSIPIEYNNDYYSKVREYVFKEIRRYSHCKKKGQRIDQILCLKKTSIQRSS